MAADRGNVEPTGEQQHLQDMELRVFATLTHERPTVADAAAALHNTRIRQKARKGAAARGLAVLSAGVF